MQELENTGMIDRMYMDWVIYKHKLPMYSTMWKWSRWIRSK